MPARHFSGRSLRWNRSPWTGFVLESPERRLYHLSPEDVAQATWDLKAKALLPVHNGRFSIANNSWDDPFIRLAAASKEGDWHLVTSIIGEVLDLTAWAGISKSGGQGWTEPWPNAFLTI